MENTLENCYRFNKMLLNNPGKLFDMMSVDQLTETLTKKEKLEIDNYNAKI